MKALVFFLLGAFFVVVGEWLYLNFINRSGDASFPPKPNSASKADSAGEKKSLSSAAASASSAGVVAPVAARGSRTVVQAVSKGRAFLDRMAAKEAGEASPQEALNKSDKTSIGVSQASAKQHTSDNTASESAASDDLERISGIGPKIAELLAAGGIGSYKALAETKDETLKALLQSAGPRYALADVSTWAAQAKILQGVK